MSTSEPDEANPLEAQYGGVGGRLVASWKKDIEETKCCGLIVLPGLATRMFMARKINEAVRRAQRDALLEAADWIDETQEFFVCHPGSVARSLRTHAKAIRIRGPKKR